MQNAKINMQKLNARTLAAFAFCILHLAFALSLTACSAKAKAATVPDGPPLAVPLAPAHEIVIEQIAEAPPQEAPPAVDPAPAAPGPITTRTPVGQKPRVETPPPPTQPAAAPPPQPESSTIRAAPVAGSATEGKVKELLSKAEADLMKRVDYQKLSPEGRAQYEQSKRFADEARQAIKERNFPYALTLAEKAATLAAELVR